MRAVWGKEHNSVNTHACSSPRISVWWQSNGNMKYKGVKYCLERGSLLQSVHKQIFDILWSCLHFDQSVWSLFENFFEFESLYRDFWWVFFFFFQSCFTRLSGRGALFYFPDSCESANVTLQQEEVLLLLESPLKLFNCLLPLLKYSGQMMHTP